MDSKHILKQLSARKNNQKKIKIIAKLLLTVKMLLIIIIFVIAGYFFNQYFSIKTIKQTSSVIVNINEFYKKNLVLLNLEMARKTILKKNPKIRSIALIKQYPSTLIISDIKKETAVYQLKVDNGYYILSTTGKIIDKSKKRIAKLASVNFYQQYNYDQYQVGDRLINNEIAAVISLVSVMKKNNIAINTIDIGSNDMILLHSDIELVVSTKKSINIQIEQLELMLQKIKQQGLEVKKIDLRFDKPILT